MAAKNLVIVESPAKAKTIEKFLGADYKVTSSYGHIRDLKEHDMSVDIDHDFALNYVIPDEKKPIVADLKAAAKKAEVVWLASDEDREGEAISWHLYEVLGLNPENTHRIVFHEITKNAILEAIKNPRDIDINLVNAQQARRVLDRIVGFEISPILWRKVMPRLSAGRVQSVAVRLIVEREREIEAFKSEESYRVVGTFATVDANSQPVIINAELTSRFKTKDEAMSFLEKCKSCQFSVSDVAKRPLRRMPAPPFTTSTLQQEASRKLHMSVSQTMSIAQRLYEGGHITYMRTDSVNLSTLCLGASKQQILATMGQEYLQTRNYTTQSKGAQEAHEAIRPTYMNQTTIEGTPAERRLYDLIWKRTIASQMADAQIEKTVIDITSPSFEEHFQASGEVIKFDGFLKVYIESRDDEPEDEQSYTLPSINVGQTLNLNQAEALERFSQHPQRYSEASLVKKMEELGIGRPSTYAPTITTILDRKYVEKGDKPATKIELKKLILKGGKIKESKTSESVGLEKGKLLPTDLGFVVTDLLVKHFKETFTYNFTAEVESEFDKIAEGQEAWKEYIHTFYDSFHPQVTEAKDERSELKAGERVIGKDPETGHTLSVKISRFGPVIQLGATNEVEKPRFAPMPADLSIYDITFEQAIAQFRFPRTLGEVDGVTFEVRNGQYGPYIYTSAKESVTIPKTLNPATLTLDDAKALIASKHSEDQKRVMRTFDEDPDLQMLNGRYGPYLSKGKNNYRLPRNKDLNALTYQECIAIMEAEDARRASEPEGGKRVRRTAKK